MRMGKGGETNFPISSINDKQSITATFSITLDNRFLPMQLINKGKTNESLLEVTFPERILEILIRVHLIIHPTRMKEP